MISSVSSRFRISSISFSGAGFLGCYHAGVYSCLLKHGYLLQPLERIGQDSNTPAPVLTGVSAGALISAAISAGVTPEDAMNVVLNVAMKTKEKGGFLDVLKPGFSLVDELDGLELQMQKALGGSDDTPGDYDNELLMNRIQQGSLLHVGLADRDKLSLSTPSENVNAYVYVDQYRNLKDVISACILSSYVPVGTGPMDENDVKNVAVKRAWKDVSAMEELRFLKDGITKSPVVKEPQEKLRYLDGGLAKMFPEIDKFTLMVSPLGGRFQNPYIAPKVESGVDVYVSDRILIKGNLQNLIALHQMAMSSSPEKLQEKFRNGYDDTLEFLDDNSLLSVFTK